MLSCANPLVVDLSHPAGAKLFGNPGGKVRLVVRRPDAGRNHRNQLTGLRPGFPAKPFDRGGHNVQLGSLLPGVDEGDSPPPPIHQINRRTIRNVNAQAQSGDRCDEAVYSRDRPPACVPDGCQLSPMDLLSRDEWQVPEAGLGENSGVDRRKPSHHDRAIRQNIHPGNPSDQAGANSPDTLQRR